MQYVLTKLLSTLEENLTQLEKGDQIEQDTITELMMHLHQLRNSMYKVSSD